MRAAAALLLSGIVLTLGCATALANRTELVSVGPGGAHVTDPDLRAASKDGTRAFFFSRDSIVAEDSDGTCFQGYYDYYGRPVYRPCSDIYMRDLSAGTTKLVSIGPTGGSGQFEVDGDMRISDDGKHVFFSTAERLTIDDMDASADVYQRDVDTGITTLVSTGPSGGQGPFDAQYPRVTADGAKVFFQTGEKLTANDPDDSRDTYLRTGGNTILVSTGPVAGNSSGGAQYSTTLDAGIGAISADGTRAFFVTRQQQTADDTDDCSASIIPGPCPDVYERDITAGTTRLVSTGPTANNGRYNVQLWGATPDGSHAYFSTAEPLVQEDIEASCPPHDGLGEVDCVDVYERVGNQTNLISTGPGHTNARDDAYFEGFTPDGAHVFFTTKEQLVDSDSDTYEDLYDRSGGTTTLISGSATVPPGTLKSAFRASSPDGSRVVFGTGDRLVADDTDSYFDWYTRHSDGTFELMSTGPIGGNGPYHSSQAFANEDATRVFFATDERLVTEDPDQTRDIYERFNGRTRLVSTGPTGASARYADFAYAPGRIADGGRRLFFYAGGALVEGTTGGLYVSIANDPPRCDAVAPDRALLWPPNGKFRTVTLAGASDPDGDAVTLSITGITQDEPLRGGRDARHAAGEDEVSLRAERDHRGDGRVYRIAFQATDAQGESCTGTAPVTVPRKKKVAAVDSAPPSYDSFGH